VFVGTNNGWQAPLFIIGILSVSFGGAGLFFELEKGNGRESYRDFGTVVALIGIAVLLLILTELFTFSSTTTTVMRVAAALVGGFAVVGLGVGISRIINERPTLAKGAHHSAPAELEPNQPSDPRRRSPRSPMTRYELLSLISVVILGLLTIGATILAAYIQKG